MLLAPANLVTVTATVDSIARLPLPSSTSPPAITLALQLIEAVLDKFSEINPGSSLIFVSPCISNTVFASLTKAAVGAVKLAVYLAKFLVTLSSSM